MGGRGLGGAVACGVQTRETRERRADGARALRSTLASCLMLEREREREGTRGGGGSDGGGGETSSSLLALGPCRCARCGDALVDLPLWALAACRTPGGAWAVSAAVQRRMPPERAGAAHAASELRRRGVPRMHAGHLETRESAGERRRGRRGEKASERRSTAWAAFAWCVRLCCRTRDGCGVRSRRGLLC